MFFDCFFFIFLFSFTLRTRSLSCYIHSRVNNQIESLFHSHFFVSNMLEFRVTVNYIIDEPNNKKILKPSKCSSIWMKKKSVWLLYQWKKLNFGFTKKWKCFRSMKKIITRSHQIHMRFVFYASLYHKLLCHPQKAFAI